MIILLLVALLWLAGCGGGSGGGQNLLFVLGLASPEVVLFQINGSGVPDTPTVAASTGSAPVTMAIYPTGQFAYVADSAGGLGRGGVSCYNFNLGSGVMTAVTTPANNGTVPAGVPVPTQVNPVALAIDSAGSFLFVANEGSNSISVFAIDNTNGSLNEITGSPFGVTMGVGPSALAITGTTLLVATAGTGQIISYTVDTSGTPKMETVAASGMTQPVAMVMDTNKSFLYVADQGAGAVAVFSISSGKLSAVTGSPFPAGPSPSSLALDPGGKFLYVANNVLAGGVTGFSVSSGVLSMPQGFSTGTGGTFTSSVAINASGRYLFAANRGGNNISAFTIGSDGKLTLNKSLPNGAPVTSPATSPVFLLAPN